MSLLNPQINGVNCYAHMAGARDHIQAAMRAAADNDADKALRMLDDAEAHIRAARAKVHEAVQAELVNERPEQ